MNQSNPVVRFAFVTMAACMAAPALGACQQKQIASLNVEYMGNGAVAVPATLKGRQVWMLLNMAAGLPMIYPGAVQKLGLKPVQVGPDDPEASVGGRKIQEKVMLDSLVLDGVNFANWIMYVMPEQTEEDWTFRDKPIVGGLSSVFMTLVDMELNLASRKLNLFQVTDTRKCPKTEAVYWGGEVTVADIFRDSTGLLSFPMEIEGKLVQASFNTNSATSRISEQVANKFFKFNSGSSGVTRKTEENGTETASYRAMAFTAKGLKLTDVPMKIYPDMQSKCEPARVELVTGPAIARRSRNDVIGFSTCVSRTPVAIGTDLMQKLRIYIAPDQGRMFFTRVE